jgi:hypothetical protein
MMAGFRLLFDENLSPGWSVCSQRRTPVACMSTLQVCVATKMAQYGILHAIEH